MDAENKISSETVEEIKAAQRLEDQQLKNDAELFMGLIRHPGWPRFLHYIEIIGGNFNRKLMEPLENSFQCVKTEHAKGALTGLSAAAQLPSAKIREAKERKLLDAEK